MTRSRAPVAVLVAAALILMLALGTRQGFGLFLHPMCSALGWRATTHSATLMKQLSILLASERTAFVAV